MKLEPFKFNLENKIVPMAQSILVTHGAHVPMVFSYDKDGVEKVSDLTDLFSVTDKEIIYKILGSFLQESDAVAFVLITEAWTKGVSSDKEDEAVKALLESGVSVRDIPDRDEVLAFQWDFRLGDVRDSGSITYKFSNDCGSIVIDYDNPMIVDNSSGEKAYSKAHQLLAGK